MTKYHVSSKTGKAAVCEATVRNCRYSETSKHYNSLKEAEAAADATILNNIIDKTLTPPLPPVIVSDSMLFIPQPYRNKYQIRGGVGYDYDYYGPPEQGCSCHEDDFCRCSEYEGLKISEVYSFITVLQDFFSTGTIPDDLKQFAENLGMDEKDAYYIEADGGLYGQEATLFLREDVANDLKKWAYSHNNSKDITGILDYCRSKGLNTVGLTPVEAIKTQLRKENNGRLSPEVENAKFLTSVEDLPLKSITVPNNARYKRSTSSEASSLTNGEAFDGVLLAKDNGEELVLIDGYRRLKALVSRKEVNPKGQFIILSEDEHTLTSSLRKVINKSNREFYGY